MIYTLTINPAIDYVIGLDRFEVGTINRTKNETLFAGGKGINVSIVLKNLGVDNVALGFAAGATGDMLESMLDEQGVNTEFLHVDEGSTRINVKMNSGIETEINGSGPTIGRGDVDRLYAELDNLGSGDILVMSGSVPPCIKDALYADICERILDKGIKVVVDARKELLADTLKYEPFLVKPNNHELGELFGVTIDFYDDAILYANKLKEMGAINAMVSMGSRGAVLVDEYGQSHVCEAPNEIVINSVGAGDTMVAAFIAKYIEQYNSNAEKIDYDIILKYAVAAGSATAFVSGLAEKEDIERML